MNISEEDAVFAMSSVQPVTPIVIEGGDGEEYELPIGIDPTDENVERFALKEAIDKLEKKDRLLIELRFFKGLTQQQTAKILNMSQVKVSRREKKICSILKTLLE